MGIEEHPSIPPGLSKEEIDQLLTIYRTEQEERWAKEREDLRAELESYKTSDKAERDELKEQIKAHDEYVKEQRKKLDDENKVKNSQHTIVTPPANIPPPVTPPGTPTPGEAPTGGAPAPTGKRGWRRFY